MSSPTPPQPPKKDVFIALLEGPSVFIHLDPRAPGVKVPAWFQKQPQLVLQVGLNMAVQIPDLRVEDDAISCTLSFSRQPFWCYLPWPAVYALVGEDGRGMIWHEDVPAEVAAKMDRTKQGIRADVTPAPAAKPKPALAIAAAPKPVEKAAEKVEAPVPAAAKPKKTRKKKGETPKPEPVPAAATEKPITDEPIEEIPPPVAKPKRELPPYLRVIK